LRLGCELVVVVFIVFQIIVDFRDIRRIGWLKWITIYKAFPAKIVYKVTWAFVLLCVPLRLLCFVHRAFLMLENCIIICAVIMTTVHFLFFCRAVKFVGPFVVMIYTIIARDLSQFIMIYITFLLGFSQSFYIVFFSCEESVDNDEYADKWKNPMQTPHESIFRTFTLVIGDYLSFYRPLATCPKKDIAWLGKFVMLFYKLCGSILLLNLLIAMMRRTYNTIFARTEEYKRQWAKVILMLEMSMKPADRLTYLKQYSVPTGTNKSLRSFTVTKKLDRAKMSEHEKEIRMEKDKEIAEQRQALYKKKKIEMEMKRANGSQGITGKKSARRMSYF
ncbi:hypothetical protein PMAYCL1PPCAC_15175, partial [Pristionchus mayeri]